jgi:dTDP-glucose pyrophosphorylase
MVAHTPQPPVTILVPMAGRGGAFIDAGFSFPKPLIDVGGKTMIELVVSNLQPHTPHRFVFVVLKDHYDRYDLHHVLKRATNNNFDVVLVNGPTKGAALTALAAIRHINHDRELVIANADQYLIDGIDDFITHAREKELDGSIMTFPSSHPRWSYARATDDGQVLEVAEKKVISNHATAGVYYYRTGTLCIEAIQNMIKKNIMHNDEFYICPAYNELLLQNYLVHIYPIPAARMFGLGTPEELASFRREHYASDATQ